MIVGGLGTATPSVCDDVVPPPEPRRCTKIGKGLFFFCTKPRMVTTVTTMF